MKCYLMLQNASVTVFTGSELLRESQQGVKLPPTQIRVKKGTSCYLVFKCLICLRFLNYKKILPLSRQKVQLFFQ